MYDYTIVPSAKIKKRMDFFYTPYNHKFQLRKHMIFEEDEDVTVIPDDASKNKQRSQTPNLTKSRDLEETKKEELFKLVNSLLANQQSLIPPG